MATGFTKDRVGTYIEKDPQGTLDYTIDWSSWINSGDSITASTWAIETISGDASPMTTSSNSFNAGSSTTTIWLSAGTAGNKYIITNTITTNNGITEERYFRIFVKDRSA
jgi:hypothetical protein